MNPLKKARKERDYGLRQLAKLIGIQPDLLSRIESDLRHTSLKVLCKLKRIYGNEPIIAYLDYIIKKGF